MKRSALSSIIVAIALATAVSAQQFVQQVGLTPGPVVWSEAVEAFDADGDGDYDIMFTNGVGFSSAQGALLPTLLINNGSAVFTDETATRIPVGFTQQGKGICACDIDQDGDQDVVFANGFFNQPRVLVNNGAGVFTDGTVARFPVLSLNSFGGN